MSNELPLGTNLIHNNDIAYVSASCSGLLQGEGQSSYPEKAQSTKKEYSIIYNNMLTHVSILLYSMHLCTTYIAISILSMIQILLYVIQWQCHACMFKCQMCTCVVCAMP